MSVHAAHAYATDIVGGVVPKFRVQNDISAIRVRNRTLPAMGCAAPTSVSLVLTRKHIAGSTLAVFADPFHVNFGQTPQSGGRAMRPLNQHLAHATARRFPMARCE